VAARRQINLHYGIEQSEDAAMLSAIDAAAQRWNVSPSEACKRLVRAGLGMTDAPAVVPAVVTASAPAIETTALIQAITALTQELVLLRRDNARLRAEHPHDAPTTIDETRVLTEADLSLDPAFLADVKKKARPGMRLEN
jgi:hypothetical protein